MGRSKILSEVSNVTHKGGTMVYTAPELFQSDRFTRECDVYSFGVILLELITLFPPQYAIRDFHIYLQSIQKKAPEFPSFFLSMAVNSLHFTNPKARPSFSEIRRTLSNHQREVQECNIDQDHLKVILLKSSCTGASPTKMSASVQDMSSVFSFFSSKYRTARSDATNTAGSKKYFRVTILVCIVAAVIAIIIILILMFGGKTSTSSSTAYSNSSSSMSAFSAPSITATPTSTPLANQGATGLWGGVNSPLLFTMSDADQSEWVIKLHAANIKVIRVIIKSSFSNNAIPDLEPTSIGIYNDTILQRIDNLMVKTVSVGIKLIIAIHDRLMLGCNGKIKKFIFMKNKFMFFFLPLIL